MYIIKEEGDGYSNKYIASLEKATINTPKNLQDTKLQVGGIYETFKTTKEGEYFNSHFFSDLISWLSLLL